MPHKLKVALLAGVCVSLLAFRQSSSAPVVQQAAFQPPTATEVFNLRSKCAELGRNVRENNVVGPALTQSEVSRYDPKTNRCYVELTVQTADSTAPLGYLNRILYDGQTGEMLAFATLKTGQKSGMIFVEVENRSNDFFENANAFINVTMADDRKQ